MLSKTICALLLISILMYDSTAKAASNDQNNYTGDRLSFPVNVSAVYLLNGVNTTVCIPAKTALRGMHPTTDSSINVAVISNVTSTSIMQCDGVTPLPANIRLTIDSTTLGTTKPNRYGYVMEHL